MLRRLLNIYILLLGTIYLLQVFSPLRINFDVYRLLSMAVSASEGQGYLVDGHPSILPLGYPFVVSHLIRFGIGTSMTLVILNLVCLLVGLWILRHWCKMQGNYPIEFLSIAFVLSSWIMIKHVTLPITEPLYFGVSLLSLFFLCLFYSADGPGKWRWLALSVVLGYLALQCRTVGLVIFPTLAITALLHRDHVSFLRRLSNNRRYFLTILIGISLLSVVVLAICWKIVVYKAQPHQPDNYFQQLAGFLKGSGIMHLLVQNVSYRVLEFGEVFTNLPQNKVPWLLPIFYLVGFVAWVAAVRGAWLLFRSRNLLPLTIYFLTYSFVMFLWLWHDARFWLPLLPILGIMFLTALWDMENRWPIMKLVCRSYLVSFFLLGLVALAFSTRISLSGKEFSELYGDGNTRMTYRYAFHQKGNLLDVYEVNKSQVGVLRILRIFEPLARTNPVMERGQQDGTPDR